MKLQSLLIGSILILILSCQYNSVYNKMDLEFDQNRWYKNSPKNHLFSIEQEGKYDVFIHFKHVYDFQFDSIPLIIKSKNPDGKMDVITFYLSVKNEKEKDRGDCVGDICDLKEILFASKEMKSGNHEVSIEHQFKHDYLPNVLGVGLSVEKRQ